MPRPKFELPNIDVYYERESRSFEAAQKYETAHFIWLAKKHHSDRIEGNEVDLRAKRNIAALEAAEVAFDQGDIERAHAYESLIIPLPAETDPFETSLESA